MMSLSKTLVAGTAFLALAMTGTAPAAGDGWETDLDTALARAKEANKPVLADFSGSDWCGWCIKLEEEVFSQEEFKTFAKKNLVPVVIDFPKDRSKLEEGQFEKNTEYAARYAVRGYPTVFLLEPDGSVFLQTGYRPGGADAYVDYLDRYLGARERVDEFLAREDKNFEEAKALVESLPEDAAALRAEVIWAAYPKEMVAERAEAAFDLIQANEDKDGKLAGYLQEVADQDPNNYYEKLQQLREQQRVQGVITRLNGSIQKLLAAREETAPEEEQAKARDYAREVLDVAGEALDLFEEPARKQMVYVFQAVAHNTLGDQTAADAAWQKAVEIDPNAQIISAAKELVNPAEKEEQPEKSGEPEEEEAEK